MLIEWPGLASWVAMAMVTPCREPCYWAWVEQGRVFFLKVCSRPYSSLPLDIELLTPSSPGPALLLPRACLEAGVEIHHHPALYLYNQIKWQDQRVPQWPSLVVSYAALPSGVA